MRKYLPWILIGITLMITIILLRNQGRLWMCECGEIYLWISDAWSSNNSQHISDPYSFSHLQHGLIFFFLFSWLFPKLSVLWRFTISFIVESFWEVLENSSIIIDRYREATAALGYNGDSIVNSVGDLLWCSFGFVIAKYLGWKKTFLLFIIIEVIMIFTIKDSLLLNVIMLIYPLEAIKNWQAGFIF